MKMTPLVAVDVGTEGWHVFANNKYVVQVKWFYYADKRPMVTLSIRRQDRKAIMDWRDLQWIKNQLVGPEVEMVQLFPAESRLVDSANQYYLHGYADPSYRFPFGFTSGRLVTEKVQVTTNGTDGGTSKQRPFAEHVKPTEEDERNAREQLAPFLKKKEPTE
jgi:hypothetical protein